MSAPPVGFLVFPMPPVAAPPDPLQIRFPGIIKPAAPVKESRVWPRDGKTVIHIAFLDGTEEQKARFMTVADRWIKHAPAVKLVRDYGIQGDVRVSFVGIPPKEKTSTPNPYGIVTGPSYGVSYGGNQGYTVSTYDSYGGYGGGLYDDDKDYQGYESYDGYYETYAIVTQPDKAPQQWSYIGTDCLGAISTPETIRLPGVTARADTPFDDLIILHGVGHILGLDFAEAVPAAPWRKITAGMAFEQLLWTTRKKFEKFLNSDQIPCNEALLGKSGRSIMLYDFRGCEGLSDGDIRVISRLYHIDVVDVAFSIHKELDMGNTSHHNDLDLYILGSNGVIYQNVRSYTRNKKDIKVTWEGWTRLVENVPPRANKIAVCNLSDRIEVIVLDKDLNVHYSSKPVNGPKNAVFSAFKCWQSKQGVPFKARDITAVESEGGCEVFLIGEKHELGHIPRQPTHDGLPDTGFYLVADSPEVHFIDNTLIDKKTKLFTSSNPVSSSSVCRLSSLDHKSTWELTRIGLELPQKSLRRNYGLCFATGFAATTQHLFVIDEGGKLHHTSNPDTDSNWLNWDLNFNAPPGNLKAVVTGAVASNNELDDYAHVFVVATDFTLYYSYVNRSNEWEDDQKECPSWITSFKGLAKAKKIFTATTQCGDLEVFAIGTDDAIYRICLDCKGWQDEWTPYSW